MNTMTAVWQKAYDLIVRPAEYQPPTYALIAMGVAVLVLTSLAAANVHATLERRFSLFARWLRDAGFFPSDDLTVELRRLDVLRIVLAACLLYRLWPDFVLFSAHGELIPMRATGMGLALSGALLFGVATPLAALALALMLNLVVDFYSGNESLGSMVVANCLIPLVIAPAGYTLSVDSALLRTRGPVGATLRGLYALWGPATLDRIQVGRFLALLAYGTLSFYSAVKHLGSPTWTSGAATAVILLSPIASPAWAPFFENVYNHARTAYVLFCVASTYGMLVWQLLLLPLALLNRWTRLFVVIWGLLFFAFSMFVLHLKELGVYEVVLWAMIFWNSQSWLVGRHRDELPFRGRVGDAMLATVVVLWVAFVVDCMLPLAPSLVGRSHRRAPHVFGIGTVNVFNEIDLQLFRNQPIARRHEPSGAESFVSFAPSEAVERALTLRLIRATDEPVFCDPEFATLWYGSYAQTLPESHRDRSLVLSMEFASWTRPTNDEFRSLRPVNIAWEAMCAVIVDLRQPKAFSIQYFPPAVSRYAADRIAGSAVWPIDVHQINLAGRFPCDQEVVSATNRVRASPAFTGEPVQTALSELWNGQTRGPVRCLVTFRRLVRELARADGNDPNVNRAGPCESEFAIAEIYSAALVDDPLRPTIAAEVTSARAAAQRGDLLGCRSAVGRVRDVYFRAVFDTGRRE